MSNRADELVQEIENVTKYLDYDEVWDAQTLHEMFGNVIEKVGK